ncbi:MAG TPA: HD-GYP domain-containing protein [Edaphobacter sp.]|nr:HD-GYP domain-containing protein [Edaphobacter sp.]
MRRVLTIDVYVLLISILAAGFLAASWMMGSPSIDVPTFLSFVVVSFLLDQSSTKLRVAAAGSTSFVMHLSAGILFGGYWGGAIAGLSTGLSVLARGRGMKKAIFNLAQRALAVSAGMLVYQKVFHGAVPPSYLYISSDTSAQAVSTDFFRFFAFAAVYVIVNSFAVNVAVSISNERPLREVWHLNTRALLGYDLGASSIAILVAFLYAKVEQTGYGPVGLVLAVVPLVVVRHIYGLYHQLQDSGQELLQVMVKAIEARDPYTSGHSLRVSALSRTIALELGLPARDVEQIETAALLHDVGKIHEEFAPLLRKEARLTDEETALMQTHSTKSAELVGIISKFRGFIQDSVRHHHERWDGQGYPLGLKAQEIPLGSRIILISDTIDAMTTDRPYRKRLPLEVVTAELQKCKGTQFDPDLVEVVNSSVAVRRLIVGPNRDLDDDVVMPGRSKRVSWPTGSLWRSRRA